MSERIHAEHLSLRDMLDELRAASDGRTRHEALRSLHPVLEEHFATEESSGGFFDYIGEAAPHHRHTVAQLRHDHRTIVEMIRQLMILDPRREASLLAERVSGLLCRLEEHERVEREIMQDAVRTKSSNRLSLAPSAQASTIPPASDRDRSLAMLTDMVDPDELSVVFQPIVDLTKKNIFAQEALVRCSVPELSPPPVLFEKAVAAGCTGRLGRMIREIGIPGADGARLFVNIHPNELNEGWLVRLDDPIFAHDHDVYLEVTESVPMTHTDLCMSVLNEVASRAGVYVVIDDLGAGYSNLVRIADLQPRVVKLDRQLIVGLDAKPRKLELVAAVTDLCHRLGADVVAEGVETVAEYHALLTTGVQYGQGYLFARPGFPAPDVVWPD